MQPISVSIEGTPNPEALKFVTSSHIASEVRSFNDAAETHSSPLAKKLFGFPWAKGIMIGPDFVTVTKQEWVDWNILAEPLQQLIQEHLERGDGVLSEVVVVTNDDTPMVARIRQIFDQEIRPAVAQDGGDIVFQKFEDGKVYVHMHGACAGCPSSTFTLKEGIETRLKEAIPEVTEVIAL
jgi:Fe-S cluster biogenesis protein NfuA